MPSGPEDMSWLPIDPQQMQAAADLGERVHVNYPEDYSCFYRRYELYSKGFFALTANNGSLLGYGVAHPWLVGAPPRLNEYLFALPKDADCLHLHDIVVEKVVRVRGHAAALVHRWIELARSEGYAYATLVAVSGTEVIWRKFGFRALSTTHAREACASYSTTSIYMILMLNDN